MDLTIQICAFFLFKGEQRCHRMNVSNIGVAHLTDLRVKIERGFRRGTIRRLCNAAIRDI